MIIHSESVVGRTMVRLQDTGTGTVGYTRGSIQDQSTKSTVMSDLDGIVLVRLCMRVLILASL